MSSKTKWNPKALVQHLISSLIGEGVQVTVWTSETQDKCVVHVCIDPKEVNKLVGERGKVAQAIHTLLDVIGKKQDQLITLKMESSLPVKHSQAKQQQGRSVTASRSASSV